MTNVSAVCSCGKDMSIEPAGEFVRLSCTCGIHKTVNTALLKKGGKDTQPVPVITKGMTEADIHAARERLATEDTHDGIRQTCKHHDDAPGAFCLICS